jgi:hypothetical protein
MAVLTNIVTADDEDVEAIGESLHPVDEWTGIEMRDVDTAKIATLHCLLTGDFFDDAVAHYEPIYVSGREGALVLRLADEATARLAELDDDALGLMAAELAATQEFEAEDWEEETIAAMLAELVELARRADAEAQALFVWMHPLRT